MLETITRENVRELNVRCAWFALCPNQATTTTDHPVLGDVPTCARCDSFAATPQDTKHDVDENRGMEHPYGYDAETD